MRTVLLKLVEMLMLPVAAPAQTGASDRPAEAFGVVASETLRIRAAHRHRPQHLRALSQRAAVVRRRWRRSAADRPMVGQARSQLALELAEQLRGAAVRRGPWRALVVKTDYSGPAIVHAAVRHHDGSYACSFGR
jgi:hypothetical protein